MSRNHVRIGSYWYSLAEDAEGNHYSLTYPPQRSPNAVVVKGEQQGAQRFQTRPDIELWSITDWSGGEGKYKYDIQAPNQHAVLFNVDGAARPGTLRPGPSIEITSDSVGQVLDDPYSLIVHNGVLYALNRDLTGNTGLKYRTWNTGTEQWSALSTAVTNVPTTGTLNYAVDTDNEYIYMTVQSGEMYRFNPGGAATAMTASLAAPAYADLAVIGDYVYLMSNTKFQEVAKTAAAATATDMESFPTTVSPRGGAGRIAKASNRLYAMASYLNETVIYEIVPSTAAGSGFSVEVLRMPGFAGESCLFQNGLLYMHGYDAGYDQSTKETRIIMYWAPGQELGSVGRVRPSLLLEDAGNIITNGKQNMGMLSSLFIMYFSGDSYIFEIDSLEGGLQQIAWDQNMTNFVGSVVRFNNEWWYTSRDAAGLMRIDPLTSAAHTTGTSYFISPYYDFGLADDKVLSSIKLLTDPLPANWTLEVWVDLGTGTFTQLTDQTTDSATSHELFPSTSAGTSSFGQMRVKVGFEYTGAGIPTSWPVLQAVEVRAQIAVHTRRWRLLLDLADELTSGDSGAKKIENLTTTAESAAVVRFDDNYVVRFGTGEASIDVIIDALDIVVTRPGEGYAQVDLVEVG